MLRTPSSTRTNCSRAPVSNPRPTSIRRTPLSTTANALSVPAPGRGPRPDTSTASRAWRQSRCLPCPSFSVPTQSAQRQPPLPTEFAPAPPARFVLRNQLLHFLPAPPAPYLKHLFFIHAPSLEFCTF